MLNLKNFFIKQLQAIPIGQIEMYGGTTAPTDWLICDGSEHAIADYPALYAVIGDNFGSASDTDHFLVPDFSGRMPLGVGTGTASDATAHTLNQQDGTEGVTLNASQTPLQTHQHSNNIAVSQHAAKNTGAGTEHTHTLSSHTHTPSNTSLSFVGSTRDSATNILVAATSGATHKVDSVGTNYNFSHNANTSGPSNNTSGKESSHTHSVGAYTHTVTGGVTGVTDAQYSSISAHSNMPPYLGINFIIYAGA